jgi:major membrane immunogen (membrane-anchored lipoprotein)
MAITPSYKKSTEATEVEEEYIDKGAVTTPQVLPKVADALVKAQADADRIDFVEWPTAVHGQEKQGI